MEKILQVWRNACFSIEMLLLGILLIVACLYIIIEANPDHIMYSFGFDGNAIGPFYSTVFRIISLCAIIFFGQPIPGLICDIFRLNPLLAASSRGIYVRFRLKGNIIPWTEVEDIKLKRRNTQFLMFRDSTCELHISVRNLDRYVRRWFPFGNTLGVVLKGVNLDPQLLQRSLLRFKEGADSSKNLANPDPL